MWFSVTRFVTLNKPIKLPLIYSDNIYQTLFVPGTLIGIGVYILNLQIPAV